MGEMRGAPVAGSFLQTASGPSGPRSRRKVFYFVDSLEVGGTETQAVELALRMPVDSYEITLGCLRVTGPLIEKLRGSAVAIRGVHPKGGLDSSARLYHMARVAAVLERGRFDVVHTPCFLTHLMGGF